MPNRATLTGILFVLNSGIPWEMLPQEEMGCGCGMTCCWRRLEEWHEAGVWDRLLRTLLDRLGKADEIDWERASLDSASAPAPGGPKDRPEPDGSRQIGLEAPCCGRPKRRPTRGDPHRRQRPRLSKALEEAVDAVSPIRRPRDRPRKRPMKLHADKGYDFGRCRKALRKRGITPRIARRGIESSEKLGQHRWVVERALSWLNRYRRLKVRYERRDDVH